MRESHRLIYGSDHRTGGDFSGINSAGESIHQFIVKSQTRVTDRIAIYGHGACLGIEFEDLVCPVVDCLLNLVVIEIIWCLPPKLLVAFGRGADATTSYYMIYRRISHLATRIQVVMSGAIEHMLRSGGQYRHDLV